MRWYSTGDVRADEPIGPHLSADAAVKFEAHVNRDGPVPSSRPELGPCWIWTSYGQDGGYGKMRVDGREVLAYRWAYEHFIGPVPGGLELDHLCRNRICVNYERHLEPVTRRENQLRGQSPAAQLARRTACNKGHEFTPENTFYLKRDNARHCRTCNKEQCRDKYLQKKAKRSSETATS